MEGDGGLMIFHRLHLQQVVLLPTAMCSQVDTCSYDTCTSSLSTADLNFPLVDQSSASVNRILYMFITGGA